MKEIGYGFFPGGDPRRFAPDSDASPGEIEAWRMACEEAIFAEYSGREPAAEPACRAEPGVGFVTRRGFGRGSYVYEVGEDEEGIASEALPRESDA